MPRWNATRSASGRPDWACDVIPDLVTVGGLTVDNVVAADGTVALDQAGGNGAYSAVGALAWVARVGLVSCAVSTYPPDVLKRLRAGGVDLAGVAWSEQALSAGSWFLYDGDGRRDEGLTAPGDALAEAGFPTDRLTPAQTAEWRAVLQARRALGEIGYSEFRERHPLRAAQVPESWRAVKGVHLAPSAPSVVAEMLDLFSRDGTTITADPGWQLAEAGLDAIGPILSRLDAFLPSEVELRALVPGAHPADAIAVLAGRCPGAVAVKMGPEGALVWDRASRAPVTVPVHHVETRDPTGAGDSFSGGFLAGLVETGDPVQAARFGAISAARVVSSFGAAGALPADRDATRAALHKDCNPCH
ncbi:carbohydrate kinase family protein [Roseibacterium sp. SDUM158017]|uniref:carbohydrate kinase family protein n=1 Tax=Roseicyclus salinarum TaxID=3036773 RepID=UPI002414FDB7|nr:carbohydrate kinase family protein [Roseibacterium sp. SDUM158017]MDG4650173.1 carbohydrate kinase family protein [Roseibacterium sp. SDUM158017]